MPSTARAALLTACFLWAVSFVATKVALEEAPPLVVVALRLAISAACFMIWIAAKPAATRLSGRQWRGLVWLSLLGTGLHYGTQTVGLQYTTASNASLYAVTGPITIVLLSAIILRERITALKTIGIAVAIVGVLVVMGVGGGVELDLRGHVMGDLLVMLSIVMWGLFTVFGKKLTDEIGALLVTAMVTLIGAIYMAPVGLWQSWSTGFEIAGLSFAAWVSVAFLGVGCSFLATLLYFVALGRSQSQQVGAYLYTIPPMTAVCAVVLIGETVTVSLVVGSILVILGVALTERG